MRSKAKKATRLISTFFPHFKILFSFWNCNQPFSPSLSRSIVQCASALLPHKPQLQSLTTYTQSTTLNSKYWFRICAKCFFVYFSELAKAFSQYTYSVKLFFHFSIFSLFYVQFDRFYFNSFSLIYYCFL